MTNPNQPPSEDYLRDLIRVGMQDTAEFAIKQFSLPYTIENGELKVALVGTEKELSRFLTRDAELLELKKELPALAKCDDEILITGETGTGKEIIARALKGDRVGKFRVVNCGGLPEHLVESELFGHMKGSFTGAVSQSQGMMQSARDGLFFLDEIGELPLAAQAKLLRAIQERKVRMVGGGEEVDINCKIVCATHCDLRQMVKENRFRQDLYARISTFEIHIPPLRERKCDFEPIIRSMSGGSSFIEAMQKASRSVADLDTPHNVRSLRQYVRRFVVLGKLPKQ